MKTQTIEPKNAWGRFWGRRWQECEPIACRLNRVFGTKITGKQVMMTAMLVVIVCGLLLGWRNAQ